MLTVIPPMASGWARGWTGRIPPGTRVISNPSGPRELLTHDQMFQPCPSDVAAIDRSVALTHQERTRDVHR